MTGRLFYGTRGASLIGKAQYADVYQAVRTAAALPAGVALTPYGLRHARISLWLAAGIPPQDAAAWAGNSIEVLLRTYAKVINDSRSVLLKRLDTATAEADAAAAGVSAIASTADQDESGEGPADSASAAA